MKSLSDRRVLVVDDLKANVQLLAKVLQSEYEVSVAFDGESALGSIAESPPDLVLLDIMMPGLDGYEVLRRLRADPKTHELPVMFLSALEDVANKARGFELGANDYLSKPFELLEVKARVRSLLRARAWTEAVREAMERELAIARSIQMGILPRDLAPVTRETGLDLAARLEPAQQVGGDLFVALVCARITPSSGRVEVASAGHPAPLLVAPAPCRPSPSRPRASSRASEGARPTKATSERWSVGGLVYVLHSAVQQSVERRPDPQDQTNIGWSFCPPIGA